MFETDTPKNINSLTLEDVKGLVEQPSGLPSNRVRMNFISLLYQILGYDLTSDVALATLSEVQSQLVLATAGGGKTTWAQVKAILQKVIRPSRRNPKNKISGDKILCLVYNKHNVGDIKYKHQQLVAKLVATGVPYFKDLDPKINACTMHSFCDFIRRDNVVKLELYGFSLMSEVDSAVIMRRTVRIVYKKLGKPQPDDIDLNLLVQLNNYVYETLLNLEDPNSIDKLRANDKFADLGLDMDIVLQIFQRYEINKKLAKKYDFIDMLYRIFCLLKSDENVLKRVQKYYEYVIADEVQDFTPLMFGILRLLVNNGTPLVCIGDEDQNIYRFRGADINALLEFNSSFHGHTYLLSRNRRCSKEILDLAKSVIERNTLRFNKELLGTRSGGSVKFIPYNDDVGQAINLIRLIKELPANELENTVICYRDSTQSALLAEHLEENGIPFNVIKGIQPFTHELYRHVFDIFNVLEMPYDRDLAIHLYKVLPCSREQIFRVLGFDPNTGKFDQQNERKHFAEYDYGELFKIKGFVEAMQLVCDLSNLLDKEPVSKIFPIILRQLNKYYWNLKKDRNNTPVYDDIFEERVKRFFNSDKKYSEFFSEYSHRKSICLRNTSNRVGVALSTFHSLKGLEFKNVFATFLDNDIFPNFSILDSKGYSEKNKLEIMESENRLWYVAITRAKDNLTVLYSKRNPSKYVSDVIHCVPETDKVELDSITESDNEYVDLFEDFDDPQENVNTDVLFSNSQDTITKIIDEAETKCSELTSVVTAMSFSDTTESDDSSENVVNIESTSKSLFLNRVLANLS